MSISLNLLIPKLSSTKHFSFPLQLLLKPSLSAPVGAVGAAEDGGCFSGGVASPESGANFGRFLAGDPQVELTSATAAGASEVLPLLLSSEGSSSESESLQS